MYTFNDFHENELTKKRYSDDSSNIPDRERQRLYEKLQIVINNELTYVEKKTLELYFFQKCSISDISGALDVNKSTASRNLSRAVKKLQNFIQYAV